MSERTGNKIWVGIAAGLLTTAVLAMVGIGAYRAGQRSDPTIEVVGQVAGEGDVARTVVVDGWRNGWHGPGPGFFLIPIVIIGLVLLFAGRRGGGPRRAGTGPAGIASASSRTGTAGPTRPTPRRPPRPRRAEAGART